MKRKVAAVLAALTVMSALMFTGCGASVDPALAEWANAAGLGVTDTAAPLTRGEMVAILGRYRGIVTENFKTPGFIDVADGDACAPYIAWADAYGLVRAQNGAEFGAAGTSPPAP